MEKEKLSPKSLEDGESVTVVQPRSQLPAAFDSTEVVTPHSYLMLSVSVAIICGILGVCTLPCSIPAVILSVIVSVLNNDCSNDAILNEYYIIICLYRMSHSRLQQQRKDFSNKHDTMEISP